MKSSTIKALDQYIANGGTPTYTSLDHARELGRGRQLQLIVTVQRALSGDAPAYLDCWIEQSVDGAVFEPKYETNPLINDRLIITANKTAVVSAGESSTAPPSAKYVRLGVTLKNIDHQPTSGRVMIMASLRGSPRRDSTCKPERDRIKRSAPGSLGRHEEVTAEIMSLAAASRGLHPHQRAAHLIRNLSPGAREHMAEVDRRIRALPPESRKQLIASTQAMVRQAMSFSRRTPAPAPAKEGCCENHVPGTCGGGPGCAPA